MRVRDAQMPLCLIIQRLLRSSSQRIMSRIRIIEWEDGYHSGRLMWMKRVVVLN